MSATVCAPEPAHQISFATSRDCVLLEPFLGTLWRSACTILHRNISVPKDCGTLNACSQFACCESNVAPNLKRVKPSVTLWHVHCFFGMAILTRAVPPPGSAGRGHRDHLAAAPARPPGAFPEARRGPKMGVSSRDLTPNCGLCGELPPNYLISGWSKIIIHPEERDPSSWVVFPFKQSQNGYPQNNKCLERGSGVLSTHKSRNDTSAWHRQGGKQAVFISGCE